MNNNYQYCQLLNVGFNKNEAGPYALRRDGVPPDSEYREQIWNVKPVPVQLGS
jgi:hypothetical protein